MIPASAAGVHAAILGAWAILGAGTMALETVVTVVAGQVIMVAANLTPMTLCL
jgi:hypothetical protein